MRIETDSYHLNICPSDIHPVSQIICIIVVLYESHYAQLISVVARNTIFLVN